MIDFATLQGLTIPEGVVTEIIDANGRVLWVLASDDFDGTLMVEKVIRTTYAGSTEYPGEEFIALDIYPKSGGTVNVTYEGVTKTVTDDGTAEVPNAQTVTFGTFNGVTDPTATPASGIVTISGDWRAVACGRFKSSKYVTSTCLCITAVGDLSGAETIPDNAFYDSFDGGCQKLKKVKIPDGVTSIGHNAFGGCAGLQRVTIPASVVSVGGSAFQGCCALKSISVASGNQYYTSEGGVLFNKSKTELCAYPAVAGQYTIPSIVEIIGESAFLGASGLTGVVIPKNVTKICAFAFANAMVSSNLASAIFENQLGWYVSTDASAVGGAPVNVRDAAAVATLLKDTNKGKYWRYTAEPFTFTLVDQKVSGLYGMRWDEWIASEYNTTTLSYDGTRIVSPDGLFLVANDTIIAGGALVDPTLTYILSDGTFAVMINGDEYRAMSGMTWGEWIDSEYNTLGLQRESYVYGGEASDDERIRDGSLVLCTGTYENATQVLVSDLVQPNVKYSLYA